MRLKIYYKLNGDKRYGPYFLRMDHEGSKHITAEEFIHLKQEQNSLRDLKRSLKSLEKETVKNCFCHQLKELSEAAGYKIRGEKLSINPKKFFTLEAAELRFGMLCKEEKERIGSAEKLLELCQKSWKLHKRLNALRQKNTLAECFRKTLCELS